MKNNDSVINFVFCEETVIPNETEPFVYAILATNIPIVLVTKIAVFEMHLKRFQLDQQITVWIHHQANHQRKNEFGLYKGEQIGCQLASQFPRLKFKYLTRAPQPDKFSNDTNKSPIVFINEFFNEIQDTENYQLISDFTQQENQGSKIEKPNSTSAGNLLDENEG
ncbi:hypothetical protein [Marinifilum flexuosum]|uniref:hypothetical protein n=1 Tax=Marinifilum flexuosum TaxID=1117708 RepID=UPI0024942B74|nr:hypothetical protein [Marinifilum flexuosum]